MSLPIAATGPPKVEMKPIFTVFCGCWAMAVPANSASTAAETTGVFLILVIAFPVPGWRTLRCGSFVAIYAAIG